MDVLANEKRQARDDTGFKVPAEKVVSTISSIDEDEKSGVEDVGSYSSRGARSHAPRRYRGSNAEDKSCSGKAWIVVSCLNFFIKWFLMRLAKFIPLVNMSL